MSSLLEQAIIDANALKEVAIKNAESALIEKYSQEFKETIEKLLEQEQPAQPEQAAQAANLVTDPTMASMPSVEPQKDSLGSNIPSSFLVDEEEDEFVEINFDNIRKQLKSMLGVEDTEVETAPEMASAEETGEESLLPTETPVEQPAEMLEEEYEFDESIANEAYDTGRVQDPADDALAAGEQDAALEEDEEETEDGETVEEEIIISEEEIQDLQEEMTVDIDIDNLSDGHMGTTVTQKREQRNLELAAARDEKEAEEREAEKKALEDLKVKLEESVKAVSKLQAEKEELKNILLSLKEHTEKLTISNAKLLYTNKALTDVSLNELQKTQIVESISRSSSVTEAKTIYNTLQSTVQGVSEKKQKESLSEALNRGSMPFMARQKASTGVDDTFSTRMKILAGIANKT